MNQQLWRQPTPYERRLIEKMLLLERDASVAAQVRGRLVRFECLCGCGSLEFDIPKHAPSAGPPGFVAYAEGVDDRGEPVSLGWVIAEGGLVCCLAIDRWSDPPWGAIDIDSLVVV